MNLMIIHLFLYILFQRGLFMNDIFISFSSADRTFAEQICSFFESNGLKCWISLRCSDLEPGTDYPQKIFQAIQESSIFVLLLSSQAIESTESTQIYQELTLANERQRMGMRIFPILVDASLRKDQIMQFAGYTLAGKEFILWSNESARSALLKEISLSFFDSAFHEKKSLQSCLPKAPTLVGRKRELLKLQALLRQTGRVHLTGALGVGKSTLLAAFLNSSDCKKRYQTILYLSIESCLLRAFASDSALNFQSISFEKYHSKMTYYAYGMYKLSLLENSVNKDALICIDHLNTENDPFLKRLLALRCDLLIASDHSISALKNLPTLNLGGFSNLSDARAFFEFFYGTTLPSEEYRFLDSYLSELHFHALSIELFAKQLRAFGRFPHEYQNQLQLQGEHQGSIRQVIQSLTFSDTSLYKRIVSLYHLQTLTNSEKALMKQLCLIPSNGISRFLFLQLSGAASEPTLKNLERMGLVQCSDTQVFLHSLLRDVVAEEFLNGINDADLKFFLNQFFAQIEHCWDASYLQNLKYRELALSIYFQFPTPTLENHRFYLQLSKLLWVLNLFDESRNIQNKVQELFLDSHGQFSNSLAEAETCFQIGLTCHAKGDYQTASEELSRAAQIFGNRYAASLSHLAQAYMYSGQKKLTEIEPLLKFSLELRQKYFPGQISEASSCHLYAKALSMYESNLDHALKLEKRAYNIFNALQPDGVNLSSASYLLGWLYVQTALDTEDILHGISLIEKAKHLRLRYRGDAYHPWMEDIYLKLGLAYQRIDNLQAAKECFEALLIVTKNKYRQETTSAHLIQVNTLLLEVYRRLHDTPNEMKCLRFLRYNS